MSKKTFYYLLAFFLVWRVSLFLIGTLAGNVLPYHPTFPVYPEMLSTKVWPRWLYSWANFDGVHYLTIAKRGYIGTGLIQAFFPLFPYVLLHTLYQILPVHSWLVPLSIFLSSAFAFLFELILFMYVKKKFSQKVAWIAVLLFFLSPTSFFFGAVYTESLFLLLVVLAFYLAEQKKWAFASVAVLLASATRIVGIFLVPALLIELWQSASKSEKKWQNVAVILAGSIGLFAYMLYLLINFKDPLYFLHVQSAFGAGRQENLVLYPQVVMRYIKILWTARPFDWKYYSYVQEFIFGVLGLIGILAAFTKIKLSQSFFSLCAFLLPTLTGTFSSMPRYTLASISLFFFLALLLQKKPLALYIVLGFSSLLMIINTILFIQGYWVA